MALHASVYAGIETLGGGKELSTSRERLRNINLKFKVRHGRTTLCGDQYSQDQDQDTAPPRTRFNRNQTRPLLDLHMIPSVLPAPWCPPTSVTLNTCRASPATSEQVQQDWPACYLSVLATHLSASSPPAPQDTQVWRCDTLDI